jgi:hypothetical protein
MALDINAIRGRLNKLQNTQKKSDALLEFRLFESRNDTKSRNMSLISFDTFLHFD